MSTAVDTVETSLHKQRIGIAALAAAIGNAGSIGDLNEARARVEAVKAWAKVHGKAKALRLDLLRIEVAALVRIVELGGIDALPARDRKAAQWLADMSPADRDALLAKSGQATTAAGMCQSIWNADELRERRRQGFNRGRDFAQDAPSPDDEDDVDQARRRVNVAGAVKSIAEDYVSAGVPFEASEIADQIIVDAAHAGDEWADDEGLIEGVREVVRNSLRRTPVLTFDGLTIPRVLTAYMDEGGCYVRVPTESARVSHLTSAIEIRAEQIERDRAALKILEDFKAKLSPSSEDDRIGDLIARSVMEAAS